MSGERKGRRKGINLCQTCKLKPALAKGLCSKCYQKKRRAELKDGLAVHAFTGGIEQPKTKLITMLPDLDAIASDPSRYLVQDMGLGRFMEIFQADGGNVFFRYTFPLCQENNPFAEKDEKGCKER